MLLKISNLNVSIDDKKILNDYNLEIEAGSIHAIMGPNGSGKSTLSKAIMGDNRYKVISGCIMFNDKDITSLPTDERARRGLFLAMQSPITIDGVSNADFLRSAYLTRNDKLDLYAFIKQVDRFTNDLKLDNKMMNRYVNKGFSGGERKKNEILQMKLLEPSMIILDEIDSGLDVDSLKIVAENIEQYKKDNPNVSILIITHYPRILEYLKPDYVHIMTCGKIVKTGDYNLALEIEKQGYNNDDRESVIKENINHE